MVTKSSIEIKDPQDLLPRIEFYRKYLNIASIRYSITLDEARDRYGLYTINQWLKLFNDNQ